MTNESEDSQDQPLEDTVSESDQTTPSSEEATATESTDAAVSKLAEDADSAEDTLSAEKVDSPADAETPDEEEAAAEPEEELDTEIRPEDLADEEGGDNEYDDFVGTAKPIEEDVEAVEAADDAHFDWYILKVQSNREKSICAALQRRVSVAGLETYFPRGHRSHRRRG